MPTKKYNRRKVKVQAKVQERKGLRRILEARPQQRRKSRNVKLKSERHWKKKKKKKRTWISRRKQR